MKIAILGAGFTGLTASYYLTKKGHKVTIFEKENNLGGLASGFKEPGWDWYLERSYHHLFSNDYDILNFAKEVGFDDIFFKQPETASLHSVKQPLIPSYKRGNPSDLAIFPLDTPLDLLKFPLLNLPQKLRSGFILAFLKISPFYEFYEKQTAEKFLKETMGKDVWDVLWKELFRKKFGKYAGNILASFFWARIKKRTKSLGYIEGGFQTFINYLEKKITKQKVTIKKKTTIENLRKGRGGFNIDYLEENETVKQTDLFDAVVSTLPTPILTKISQNLFPESYLSKFRKIKYLHAVNLILETPKPILDRTYWLNICVNKIPFMVLVQHTNYVDKKNYGGKNLLYIGNYVDSDDKLLKMNKDEIINYFSPYIRQISIHYSLQTTHYSLFKAPFAQPIFDSEFLHNKPQFITPVKNFYIANLDMTYPYDRGTNYAVRLGKEVSEVV